MPRLGWSIGRWQLYLSREAPPADMPAFFWPVDYLPVAAYSRLYSAGSFQLSESTLLFEESKRSSRICTLDIPTYGASATRANDSGCAIGLTNRPATLFARARRRAP